MGADPRIACHDLRCGDAVSFGERVQLGGIGGAAEQITIGDNVSIGDDVRIFARQVHIGDYAVIHNHTTIYGYDSIRLGACGWIGQNVILNCTASLEIGRGCTVSAYSSIWTHFSGGDVLQGCRYDACKPCTLGDDVWIGVQCSIGPVRIEEKSLLLAGSVLTKDVPPNTVWGGNPATDLTLRLGRPYVQRSVEAKFAALCEQLRAARGESESVGATTRHEEAGFLTLGGITVTMVDIPGAEGSVFDVRDRTYSRLRTPQEIAFMRYLLPKIKFYPRES